MKNTRYGTLARYRAPAATANPGRTLAPPLARRTYSTVRATAIANPPTASAAIPSESAANPIAAAMTGTMSRAHPQPPGLYRRADERTGRRHR